MDAVEAVAEIFTWIGFGAGILLAGVALIAYLLDGTWVPARAAVEPTEAGPVARWFDEDGEVNEARLTPEQEHEIGDSDWAEVFVRRGSRNRLRLARRSPQVRALSLLAAGLIGVGVVALLVSAVALFAAG
jgi:hypothetical protein